MSEKVSDQELCALLAACPPDGAKYRHYKTGRVYVVIGSAIAEATQEPLVIYRSVGGATRFARPFHEWGMWVHHDGHAYRRFEAVVE